MSKTTECDSQAQPEWSRRDLIAGTAAALALAAFPRGSLAEDATAASGAPNGWQTASPREEIRPEFSFDPKGGPSGGGCFVIRSDSRSGLDGCWTRTFAVSAGKY